MIHTSFSRFLTILSIGLFTLAAVPVHAQEQSTEQLSQADVEKLPLALEGYDVVSYFDPSPPQKGSETYQAVYGNKRFLFLNAQNQKRFSVDPQKYLPEFDEYCGCALSEGEFTVADPKVYKIVDGRLVLFKDSEALNLWNKDEAGRYLKAQNVYNYENQYDAGKRLRDDTSVRLFKF